MLAVDFCPRYRSMVDPFAMLSASVECDRAAAKAQARAWLDSAAPAELVMVYAADVTLRSRPRSGRAILREWWRRSAAHRDLIAAVMRHRDTDPPQSPTASGHGDPDGDLPAWWYATRPGRFRALVGKIRADAGIGYEEATQHATAHIRQWYAEQADTGWTADRACTWGFEVTRRHDPRVIRAPRSRAAAARRADDDTLMRAYTATRAGVDDEPWRDDDSPLAYEEPEDRPDQATTLDPTWHTPCVVCGIERSTAEQQPAPGRDDDGLCQACRDRNERGIPQPAAGHPRTRAEWVAARCAYLTTAYPTAARRILGRYWQVAGEADRAHIQAWATRYLPRALAPTLAAVPGQRPPQPSAAVQRRRMRAHCARILAQHPPLAARDILTMEWQRATGAARTVVADVMRQHRATFTQAAAEAPDQSTAMARRCLALVSCAATVDQARERLRDLWRRVPSPRARDAIREWVTRHSARLDPWVNSAEQWDKDHHGPCRRCRRVPTVTGKRVGFLRRGLCVECRRQAHTEPPTTPTARLPRAS
ncbi:hypothetical protein GCM10012275_54200 [Longimycelium tulufanense]|uniref:Uncharacterized protein n=1 Tax=Longimycelium tulufanense TaxID=907463 RepID=A0A8J3CD52_9PSEU|nr:hypothetical protein [Longimycelium tulufanense]GGM76640.1 hypothetical protein GCM10012275_54200 [Longimycelium tulufanense]